MTKSSAAQEIVDWLLGDGRTLEVGALVDSLGHRLTAAGLPVHRMTVGFSLLNPSVLAAGIVWRPGEALHFNRYEYAERDTGLYERSPFKVADEENRWVEIDVEATADDAYGIIPDLKEQRLKHYVVIPMPDSTGRRLSITLASRDRFTPDQFELVRRIIPALRMTVEVKTLHGILLDVVSTYVGRAPAREILSGSVHRGEVTEVRAAIFVSDLRGFTHLSTRLPPAATAEVINNYYDVVVPAIEAHGGEVLKFIGDAVLAIFPVDTLGEDGAVLAALEAARAARSANCGVCEVGSECVTANFGIAIHVGEAAYGNVGSGNRLDFTVIGRDVNISARIASLCSRLGQEFLVSEAVAEIARRHGQVMVDAGSHEVRGLPSPLTVYVPDGATDRRPCDDGVSVGPALMPVQA